MGRREKLGLKEVWKFIVPMSNINMSILNEYYMYLLCIYILTIIRFFISFIFKHQFCFGMNMYANQYNNLPFFIPKILDMNQLFKSYITTNIYLIVNQRKYISLQ